MNGYTPYALSGIVLAVACWGLKASYRNLDVRITALEKVARQIMEVLANLRAEFCELRGSLTPGRIRLISEILTVPKKEDEE